MTQIVEKPSVRRGEIETQTYELGISRYDRVASMLLALLMLVGATVLLLFLIWLTSTLFAKQTPVPVELAEVSGGEGGVSTEGLNLDAPDVEEMAQELELEEPRIEQMMATIVDAVTERLTDLDDPALTEELVSGGRSASSGSGGAPFFGEGEGEGGIPRAARWEVFFQEGGDLDSYARQLAYFKIELGVIGDSGQVTYAYNLVKPAPDRREGGGKEEDRLYMSWRSGKRQQADRRLLALAEIATRGRLIVQFYPAAVENRLAQLEGAFAGRSESEIRKTRFGVRTVGNGYEFYVLEQIPL